MGGKRKPGLYLMSPCQLPLAYAPKQVVVMSTEPFPGGHDTLKGLPGASKGKDILFRDFNRQV